MKKLFLFLVISLGLNGELVETFYKTGELKERYSLKNGIRDGIYTKRYLNGQIGRQVNYKTGVMDGELKTWYPNGMLKTEFFYRKKLLLPFSFSQKTVCKINR